MAKNYPLSSPMNALKASYSSTEGLIINAIHQQSHKAYNLRRTTQKYLVCFGWADHKHTKYIEPLN